MSSAVWSAKPTSRDSWYFLQTVGHIAYPSSYPLSIGWLSLSFQICIPLYISVYIDIPYLYKGFITQFNTIPNIVVPYRNEMRLAFTINQETILLNIYFHKTPLGFKLNTTDMVFISVIIIYFSNYLCISCVVSSKLHPFVVAPTPSMECASDTPQPADRSDTLSRDVVSDNGNQREEKKLKPCRVSKPYKRCWLSTQMGHILKHTHHSAGEYLR